MTDDKWQDLRDNIKEKFGILEEGSEPDMITDDVGNEIKGMKDFIIFNGPSGKMKTERTKRPMIIEKKSHYHKTQAGKALTEYIVSDTETTQKTEVFSWDEINQDWKEIDTHGDKLSF